MPDTTVLRSLTVTGPITASGGVVGGNLPPVTLVTADGAITIPSVNTTFVITKAGVAAMTIANPTTGTHDGLELTFIATTASAHTLTRSTTGFNDAGASGDVATFGGAKGDNIVIVAYAAKWYVKSSVNVTLG